MDRDTWPAVVFLVGFAAFILYIVLVVLGALPEPSCEAYRYQPIRDVPARCYDHFRKGE